MYVIVQCTYNFRIQTKFWKYNPVIPKNPYRYFLCDTLYIDCVIDLSQIKRDKMK